MSAPFTFGDSTCFWGNTPDVFGAPGDPHGSGCAPGPGPLPDGAWYGYATGFSASSVEFDLACFYTGDTANAVAAERGEESPVPNDYLAVNDNPSLRTVPAADDAIGYRLVGDDHVAVSYRDFIADPGEFHVCPGESCHVWLYVNGGEITEIVKFYVP